MAYIKDDKVRCECGCSEYLKTEKVVINSDFKNNKVAIDMMPQIGISDRFIEEKKIAYICAKCGKELSC